MSQSISPFEDALGSSAAARAIRFSHLGVRFVQAWYDEPVKAPLPDITIRRNSSERPAAGPGGRRPTLVNDLSAPEEEIFATIRKSCRYKIRRAETKDLAACSYEPAPFSSAIDAFIAFYANFARQKRLAPISRRRFRAIAEAGRLRLSQAELGGTIVARHAYIACGEYVRAHLGASPYRSADAKARAAIGRTNRLLNWHDMLAFKSEGFRYFDWGGLFEDERVAERKAINDFKREFGGVEAIFHDGFEAHTPLGRTIIAAASLADAALKRGRG